MFSGPKGLVSLERTKGSKIILIMKSLILYMIFLLSLKRILRTKKVPKFQVDLNTKSRRLLLVLFMKLSRFSSKICLKEKEPVFLSRIRIKSFIRLTRISSMDLELMSLDRPLQLKAVVFLRTKEEFLKVRTFLDQGATI